MTNKIKFRDASFVNGVGAYIWRKCLQILIIRLLMPEYNLKWQESSLCRVF